MTDIPAFPSKELRPNERGVQYPHHSSGMTLRDYFAGQALVGLYAGHVGDLRIQEDDLKSDADLFYQIADAMMEARK